MNRCAAADPPEGGERRGRLLGRREGAHSAADRAGHEHAEEILARMGLLPEGRQPLRAGQHPADAPPLRRAARPQPVPPRPALRLQNGEIVIVDEFTGRLMPGRRWSDGLHQAVEAKEGRADPEREPDAGLDHLPELLPHVRQAVRHDRHGRHRGLRVPPDLRSGNGGHPDQPSDDPRRPHGPGLSHRAGEAPRHHRRHPRLPRARPAGAGRHHLDRELRAALRHAHKEKLPHQVLNAKQHAREARSSPRPAGPA
jgi:hypothetical protein